MRTRPAFYIDPLSVPLMSNSSVQTYISCTVPMIHQDGLSLPRDDEPSITLIPIPVLSTSRLIPIAYSPYLGPRHHGLGHY